IWRNFFICGGASFQDGKCAFEGISGTGKFCKDAVSSRVRDATTMLRDETIADASLECEETQRGCFVAAHQASVTGNISAEDRCKASRMARAKILWHAFLYRKIVQPDALAFKVLGSRWTREGFEAVESAPMLGRRHRARASQLKQSRRRS
ncbi:MAG: hypothetical protein ABW003_08970, partial [Microvirga sp.]